MARLAYTIQFDYLDEFAGALPDAVAQALDKGAELIEMEAKSNAPVRTGALRASGFRITDLHNDFAANAAEAAALNPYFEAESEPGHEKGEVTIGFSADYAAFVHDGTSGQAGNPFFMSALERNYDTVLDMVGKAIEAAAAQGGSSSGGGDEGESSGGGEGGGENGE